MNGKLTSLWWRTTTCNCILGLVKGQVGLVVCWDDQKLEACSHREGTVSCESHLGCWPESSGWFMDLTHETIRWDFVVSNFLLSSSHTGHSLRLVRFFRPLITLTERDNFFFEVRLFLGLSHKHASCSEMCWFTWAQSIYSFIHRLLFILSIIIFMYA